MITCFAHSQQYLAVFQNKADISVVDADAYLHEYTHAGMEDMFLCLATVYQQRFPKRFEDLDPRNFILPAAFMAFRNNAESLQRLQQLVEDSPLLMAGVEEGINRAAKLKADQAMQALADTTSGAKSDLAQRPHDAALVPGHK